jgi:hypothetical protein
MEPRDLLSGRFQGQNATNFAALLFLSSVKSHADTSTGLLDQHFFYESEQGWLSSQDFLLLLRLQLENSTAFQRVDNAKFHVAPEVLRRNRFWINVLKKICKGLFK